VDWLSVMAILAKIGISTYEIVSFDPPKDSNWLRACEEAMNWTYQDNHGNLQRFEEHVKYCINNHVNNFTKYAGSYFAIVQASGHGKTRLTMEFGKQVEPVIYISLAESSASSYPPGNVNILRQFREAKSEDSMVILICALVVYGINQLRQIIDGTICNSTTSANVHAPDLDRKIILRKFMELQRFDKMLELEKSSYAAIEVLIRELDWARNHELKFPNIFIVLDECRTLLQSDSTESESPFRFFRKALRYIDRKDTSQRKGRVFAIVCDTSSKVSNFALPKELDPSMRNPHANSEYFLHEPFVHVINVNKSLMGDIRNMTSDSFFAFENFLTIGRPI
jgi:hypothetical protein